MNVHYALSYGAVAPTSSNQFAFPAPNASSS